jgi:hypothetical protein
MRGPPLSLGYLLRQDPDRYLRFACNACPHWIDKPLPAMCVALGEDKLLKDIKPKCSRCGARGSKVTLEVWKDTWSGPR